MALVIETSTSQAIPVIERNTFLTVYCGDHETPKRRCSSLPARMRDYIIASQYNAEVKDKASDGIDSEAITDVCTEASDDIPASFTDSQAITDSDCEMSYVPIVVPVYIDGQETVLPAPTIYKTPLNAKAACYSSQQTTAVTPLNASAACWAPPPPAAPEKPMWRVGAAKNQKWKQWWKDSAGEVVAQMGSEVGKLDCVARVESNRNGSDWTVTIKSSPEFMYQFERIQTVAKQALLKAGEASECIYVLGHKWTPFQALPMGFFASLGSMKTPKQACWDVYENGVCPRGCACLWEHPASVNVVTVIVDFGADA